MVPQKESRTAILVILFVFQAIVFIFELLHLPGITPNAPAWLRHLQACLPQANKTESRFRWLALHLLAPTFVGFIAAPLFAVTFAGQGRQHPGINGECTTNLDADVAGDGVRVSVWVQGGVLLFIAFTGTFHPFTTGIKEVGGGLVITHISLAIALAVQMGRKTLSSVDAVIGCLILDAQNSALSIQLAGKETLAARWQAKIVMGAQFLGLVILPIIMTKFHQGAFAKDGCQCFSFFWWGWLSNCPLFPPSELRVFWVYYALRGLFFVQSGFHTLWNMVSFDEAEKVAKGKELGRVEDTVNGAGNGAVGTEEGMETDKVNGSLIGITYPDPIYPPGNKQLIKYGDYPATATLMYVVHGVTAITSMTVSEAIIRDYSLRPSSQVYSVGQVIALVVSGSTVLRALWLFLRMFRKDSKSWERWKEWKVDRKAAMIQPVELVEIPPSPHGRGSRSSSQGGHSDNTPDRGSRSRDKDAGERRGSGMQGFKSLPDPNARQADRMMSRRNTDPSRAHRHRTFQRSDSGTSQLERRSLKSHRFGIIWPFTLELATAMYFKPEVPFGVSVNDEENKGKEVETRQTLRVATPSARHRPPEVHDSGDFIGTGQTSRYQVMTVTAASPGLIRSISRTDSGSEDATSTDQLSTSLKQHAEPGSAAAGSTSESRALRSRESEPPTALEQDIPSAIAGFGRSRTDSGTEDATSTDQSSTPLKQHAEPGSVAAGSTLEARAPRSGESERPAIYGAAHERIPQIVVLSGSATDIQRGLQSKSDERPTTKQGGPSKSTDNTAALERDVPSDTDMQLEDLAGTGSWIKSEQLRLAMDDIPRPIPESSSNVQNQASTMKTGLVVDSSEMQFGDWLDDGIMRGPLVMSVSSGSHWSMVSVPSYFFQRSRSDPGPIESY
ncbi:hypothetical protein QBC43DRAFT_54799 [Cladorrhinum sp. PSN259]|nr:hypothetical protein QBC43DRAFT_54799 [Cladorrhinum sp. PSN259]